jgi:putative FmdB family regulatory protein
MPIYEYEHLEAPCGNGKVFEVKQPLADDPLSHCPNCGGAVRKLISLNFVSSAKTNSELRDMGFTKLVKRDDGVYENVTRRKGESRYMERNKPETMPHIKKIISD